MQHKGPIVFKKHDNMYCLFLFHKMWPYETETLEVQKIRNTQIMFIKCNKKKTAMLHMWFITWQQSQMRYVRRLLIVIKMQNCCSVTSVQLLTSAYQTQNPLHTLACNSLSWETVAIIFVAITLIRGKHTDGVVSQTHGLRIKMSSLPKLVMVWETNPK